MRNRLFPTFLQPLTLPKSWASSQVRLAIQTPKPLQTEPTKHLIVVREVSAGRHAMPFSSVWTGTA